MTGTAGLFEREDETEEIEGAIRRAADGQGSVLLIHGEAGIGKTRLIEHACGEARRAGLRVLSASGGELESDLAFGVARQLFFAEIRADRAPEGLGGTARAALEVLRSLEPRGAQVEVAAVVQGLHWLVAALSESGPLLIAVDDAHWSDAGSLRLLAFLARRIADLPVALIVAARPGSHGPELATLRSTPGACEVEVPALGPAGVTGIVRESLGSAPTDSFRDACLRAAGGNPLMTSALLETIKSEGLAPDDGAAGRIPGITPAEIARRVEERLAGLPEAAAQLCAALAVLGRSASLVEACELSAIDPAAAPALTDQLEAEGLLARGRPLRFAHPVLREAAYGAIREGARRDLHRRAAAMLAGRGDDPGRVGMHLMASDRLGDPWVVERLREAAEFSVGSGAPEIAVGLLRRAVEEFPGNRADRELLEELGRAEMLAGLPEAPENLARAAEMAANESDRTRIGLLRSRALLQFGAMEAAIEALDQLRAEASPSARGAIEAELAGIRATSVGNSPGLTAELAELERSIARLDDPSGRDGSVLAACRAFSLARQARPRAEVIAASEGTTGSGGLLELEGPISMAHVYLCLALVAADELDLVARENDAAVTQAREMNLIWAQGSQLCIRGWIAHARGDLGAAEADAAISLELADVGGYMIGIPASLGLLAKVMVEQGRPGDALALYESRGMAAALPELSTVAFAVEARGRAQLALGKLELALADLLEAGRRFDDWGVLSPALGDWRTPAAAAAAALGDHRLAIELSEQAVELAERSGAPRALLRCRTGLASLETDPDRRAALLRAALDEAPQGPLGRLERCSALVELGESLAAAGSGDRARGPLREGLDGAFRSGAAGLVERARDALKATGARPRRPVVRGVEALTPGELRVSRQASQGLSNREIAERLYLSQKTVESHLSSSYRKLGISARDELAEVLEPSTPAAKTSG